MNCVRDYRVASLLATLLLVAVLGYFVNKLAQPDGRAAGAQVWPVDTTRDIGAPGPGQELAMRFRESVFMLHAHH